MTHKSIEKSVEAVTAQLAMFVERCRWQDLPENVVAKATLHILDGVGCAAVGSLLPWINQIQAYASDTGKPGAATVIGGSDLVPEWAAFSNATAAHGFELDDYHSGALAHPGCVVVPTALAIGEVLGSSGQDIVLACALGMEAIVRIGLAVSPSMVVDRGFHETCTQGVFGASVAASKLMGLKADTIVSALGLAGSHASGTRQYSHSGGEVKRLHAGLGASGGIRSARLADRGFQGPPAILEGSRGFMQAFANEYDPTLVTRGLGESWQFLDCGIKPHASCGLIHAPTDALIALLSEHRLAAADIAEVVVGADRLSLEHVGSLPLLPQDMNGAQFNLPYSLGMILAGRASGFSSYWQLQKSGFGDPAILEAAKRVRMVLDPEVDAAFPKVLTTRVRIRTVDGKSLERMSIPVGSKESPLSQNAVKAKFLDLLSQTRWASKADELADKIQELQTNTGRASVMGYFAS
jgi:2-methylcitrate dehydratase PrpD